jgi:hypothetical protein
MIKLIITLDYEIRGNGTGSPKALMIEPTNRLIKLFNKYGAKVTIMADIAQILKYKEYYETTHTDKFNYLQIVEQLQSALQLGHDVQLHMHPSFFNSTYINHKWEQDWEEYNVATLEYNRINQLIKTGKNFLEDLLKPVDKNYKCYVFRAGNWAMMPSKNIIKALINNGIKIDTSIFKYGHRKGLNIDYTDAYHNILPWPVDHNDIRFKDETSTLTEFTICCEKSDHIKKSKQPINILSAINRLYYAIFKNTYPLKMDINLCTGKQLIKQLIQIENKYRDYARDIPLILIGHSKSFNYINQMEIKRFLEFLNRRQSKYSFSLFKDINSYSHDQNLWLWSN